MHTDWKGPYNRRLQKAASERGRNAAKVRWQRDGERRSALARVTAEQYPNRIVRRVIVINDERIAREAVIFEWDSEREAGRKVRKILESSHSLSGGGVTFRKTSGVQVHAPDHCTGSAAARIQPGD